MGAAAAEAGEAGREVDAENAPPPPPPPAAAAALSVGEGLPFPFCGEAGRLRRGLAAGDEVLAPYRMPRFTSGVVAAATTAATSAGSTANAFVAAAAAEGSNDCCCWWVLLFVMVVFVMLLLLLWMPPPPLAVVADVVGTKVTVEGSVPPASPPPPPPASASSSVSSFGGVAGCWRGLLCTCRVACQFSAALATVASSSTTTMFIALPLFVLFVCNFVIGFEIPMPSETLFFLVFFLAGKLS